jgi:hypothetical protein
MGAAYAHPLESLPTTGWTVITPPSALIGERHVRYTGAIAN